MLLLNSFLIQSYRFLSLVAQINIFKEMIKKIALVLEGCNSER